ncbi:hypothetical protein NQ318_001816 [Aromia moschata]|uniref:Ankyrin repeat protein n=1 Tax=Aromia moschata TaxID=1265417 RepID=A0AAV8Z1R6_9CUCU|nr:hypothetical protein NQ318_001816 [Aromia moschata]
MDLDNDNARVYPRCLIYNADNMNYIGILHEALEYGIVHKIKILLPNTLDINMKNDRGYTALHVACQNDCNEEVLDLLLQRNDIDPNVRDNEGFTPLHTLASRGNLPGIKQILNKFPFVNIDAANETGNSPLMMASKRDHAEVIEYLCKKGANVNHQNKKYYTALHYAANSGYTHSMTVLIKLGEYFYWAKHQDIKRICKTIRFLNAGADLNAKDSYGITPLMRTCKWGFLDTCKILLEAGADLNQPTPTGQTALQYSSVNYPEVTKLLITFGADVNYPGPYSNALFHCAKTGNVECARELLEAGASATGLRNGRSALDVARQYNNAAMLEFLTVISVTDSLTMVKQSTVWLNSMISLIRSRFKVELA